MSQDHQKEVDRAAENIRTAEEQSNEEELEQPKDGSHKVQNLFPRSLLKTSSKTQQARTISNRVG